jgi:hypothetical protein
MTVADRVGLWFTVLEKEFGECCDMPFGIASADGTLRWEYRPHAQYDGYGALSILTDGRPVAPPRPQEAPPAAPNVRSDAAARWRKFEARPAGPPCARAFVVWDASEAAAIVQRAKALGVSVNSLLLAALGRIVAPHADRDTGAVLFDVPVNMRGVVSGPPEHGNHIANLAIDIGSGSAREVHEQVRRALAAGEHVTAWMRMNVRAVRGEKVVADIIRQTLTPGFRMGIFSNVGVWRSSPDIRSIVCAPPALTHAPLGMAVTTWNDRMGIMAQLHPSLAAYAPELDGWLVALREEALGLAA